MWTNLKLEWSHKNLQNQGKNEARLIKDVEVDIQGRDPKLYDQYKLPLESTGPVSANMEELLWQGILKKVQSMVNNCILPIKKADIFLISRFQDTE